MASARRPGQFTLRAIAAAVVAVSLAGASVARAEEPIAPEVDTNPSTLPPKAARPNLMLVGAAVTVGWYGAAVGTSYLWQESPSAHALRIPVAGPYMALAKTGCGSTEPNCHVFTVVVRTVLTSLSLVGQTGGLLAMFEGAFVPTSAARSSDAQRAPTHHVAVVPTSVSAGSAGVSLVGEF